MRDVIERFMARAWRAAVESVVNVESITALVHRQKISVRGLNLSAGLFLSERVVDVR